MNTLAKQITLLIGLISVSLSLPILSVQAIELSGERVIKSCSNKEISLNSPQLTTIELKTLISCKSKTLPQLINSLDSKDWKVQVIAVYAIGLFGKEAKPAITVLSNLIDNKNPDIRFAAAQSLGMIGTETVIPALKKAIHDKDENVRVSAVDSIFKVGELARKVKPELIDALWDGNWYVRSKAAATISKLGLEESDIPQLMKPWREGFHPDEGALISLIISINPHIRNKIHEVPIFFLKALQSKNPKVRESAAVALGDISKTTPGRVFLNQSAHALLRLLQDKDPKVRQRAIESLGTIYNQFSRIENRIHNKIKVDSLVETKIQFSLLQRLQDPESEVRLTSVKTLKKISDISRNSSIDLSNFISPLSNMLNDPEPEVRLGAINLLVDLRNFNIEPDSNSTPAKLRLKKSISTLLKKSLFDQNKEVRRISIKALNNTKILSDLIMVLQNKDAPLELRRTASSVTWLAQRWDRHFKPDEDLIKILKYSLQDTDLEIRLNAAISLQSINLITFKKNITVLKQGLQSHDPLLRLDSIINLSKLCSRSPSDRKKCSETKIILPQLIIALSDEIKSIRYAASLFIADIMPTEERNVITLTKMLLEHNRLIRDHAINALQKIGTKHALLSVTQSSHIDDKKARYSRSCLYDGYLPTGDYVDMSPNYNKPPFTERLLLLLNALSNENVRFSSSETLNRISLGNLFFGDILSKVESTISELDKLLVKMKNVNRVPIVLNDIFNLKNVDLRRSIVYSLGNIGKSIDKYISDYSTLLNLKDYVQLSQARTKIIRTLISIADDQTEDLNIRWVASVFLQKLNIDKNQFFIKTKLINPEVARWNFPHGFSVPWAFTKGRISGFILDIYSMEIIYDSRIGCGSGLAEIYETLRDLLLQKN